MEYFIPWNVSFPNINKYTFCIDPKMEKSLGKFMNYTEHKVIIIYFFWHEVSSAYDDEPLKLVVNINNHSLF